MKEKDSAFDLALLQRFEAGDMTEAEWDHTAHIHVAWALLSLVHLEEAVDRMRVALRAFQQKVGAPDLIDRGYHETLTRAWFVILDSLRRHYPCQDAASLLAENQFLLDKRIIRLFYSRERLMSMEAKRSFVEPDLAPLPG